MELTDPSDWPGSMPELRTIDNLLRCAICCEFLNTAMILTGCSHNFCSLCIRRYIGQENKCPSCKTATSVSELINNRVMDEIVNNFVAVRPQILKLCCDNGMESPPPVSRQRAKTSSKSSYSPMPTDKDTSSPRRSARSRKQQNSHISQELSSNDDQPTEKVNRSPSKQTTLSNHFHSKQKQYSLDSEDSSDDFTTATPSRRCNRKPSTAHSSASGISKPSSTPPQGTSSATDLNRSNEENIKPACSSSVGDDADDDDEVMIVDEQGDAVASTSSESRQTPTKKAPCPVCGAYIHSKYINTHLDACLVKGDKRESKRRTTPNQKPRPPKRKPLPKLVHNLMSDKDLRKKLKEHKLPHQGNRQVLIKRLREFTLLYNADCDSAFPKSIETLVKEVEKNEKVKVQQPSKKELKVTRLKVEKGQTEEEMHKHQQDYLNAHKNQFDKLVHEARERMKKARAAKKKQTNDETKPSTSTTGVDMDENSKDSVTIMQVEDTSATETSTYDERSEILSKACAVPLCIEEDIPLSTVTETSTYDERSDILSKACAVISCFEEEIPLSEDVRHQEEATMEKQEEQKIADEKMSTMDKSNVCVSLTFTPEIEPSTMKSDGTDNTHSKPLPNDEDSLTVPVTVGDTPGSSGTLVDQQIEAETISNSMPTEDDGTELKEQGTSSTESISEKLDNSVEDNDDDDPSSPSLLNSQVVLGDNANYTVSIHNNQDASVLGHSGLLDTLMSDDDPSISGQQAAVLVPSSPSTTSKAGEDTHCEIDPSPMQEGSEESSLHSHDSPACSLDLNCIPESPQPSTSGVRQRKRKKQNPSTNSESGSSVGDDNVGLRRSSRRNKKAKPNAT